MNKIEQILSKNKNIEKLSMLTTEEREAVLEFTGLLRERFGSMIRGIVLFGSKISGKSGEESDIDILIVLKELSWEIKKTISGLAAEENLKHNVIISTIRYDEATWENPVVKASPFGRAVREDGIWV